MRLSRLDDMEKFIMQRNSVTLTELISAFQMSEITIRRDLVELEKRGNVRKVYGGVVALKNMDSLLPLKTREQTHKSEKEIIGELAASLVEDHETVFVDSGTTATYVIRHLATKQDITIVSHSLPALAEAAKYNTLNIISIGGFFSPPTASFVGGSAQNQLSGMNINTAFMGTTGFSIENGLSNSIPLEAEFKRCVVAQSKKIILLADHFKFGQNALLTFCTLDQLNAVVTDCLPNQQFVDFFAQHHIPIITKYGKTI